MASRILVSYASKYGATAEIATFIGDTLSEAGFLVEVIPAEHVHILSPYSAVVLGSAVYAGRWRKEAVEFLETFEDKLAHLPVWFFSSGPTGEGDPVELMNGWRFPEGQQSLAARIAPRDITVFHGAIEPDRLNLGEKLLVRALRAKTGDFRDWNMIRKWANEVARELAPLPAASIP